MFSETGVCRFIRSVGGTVLAAALLWGCQPLPANLRADLTDQKQVADQPVGKNSVGEDCRYHEVSEDSTAEFPRNFNVYCGSWQQPSGRIRQAVKTIDAAGLAAAAAGGSWRVGLDQHYSCGTPQELTIIEGATAVLLQCTQKGLNIPHLALVTDLAGKSFYADGVPSALPAIENTIAAAVGHPVAAAQGAQTTAAEQIASASASKPFGSGDLDDYYNFMRLGGEANGSGDYASAEKAYRNALAVQQRILGSDDPGLTVTLMHLALQLSDEQRFTDAQELFDRADRLAPRLDDPLVGAMLVLYEAEHQANHDEIGEATKGVTKAIRAFTPFVPDQLVRAARSDTTGGRAGLDTLGASITLGPDGQSAVAGLAEAWRFEAYLAYKRGDYRQVDTRTAAVGRLLKEAGLSPPGLVPRSLRLAALSQDAVGKHDIAAGDYLTAAALFQKSEGTARPEIETIFLAARNAVLRGDLPGALALYRQAADAARQQHVPVNHNLIDEYLATLEKAAAATPGDAGKLAAEGFEAMQLVQGDQASQVLAKAFARLSTGDETARRYLRTMQDDDLKLEQLLDRRDTLTSGSNAAADKTALAALDKEIAETQTQRNDAEAAIQAATPEYSQLVAHSATAEEVQKRLAPHEALLTFESGRTGNHASLIEQGRVLEWSIGQSEVELTATVAKLRATIVPAEGSDSLPVFDVAGAHALYETLLGPAAAELAHLERLVVVPSEPLSILPLGVLVTADTAPVKDGDYRNVPFLVNKLALSYFPSAQNFVLLRSDAKPSSAANPYIGFGDFRPATASQLKASFPSAGCAGDLAALVDLPELPGTAREIQYIGGELFHAPAADLVLGQQFVKSRLAGADLSAYRIVHLATHALLPTDLSCRSEPTIIASTPPDAPDADGAFVGISEILSMKLDADLVVLSACNTGPNGKSTGDSLSGLARAFFFAGARGLLVTHWELEDRAGPLLAALTLNPSDNHADTAAALQTAQLSLMQDVSKRLGASGNFYTHPFIWAPFVLIGDGVRPVRPAA